MPLACGSVSSADWLARGLEYQHVIATKENRPVIKPDQVLCLLLQEDSEKVCMYHVLGYWLAFVHHLNSCRYLSRLQAARLVCWEMYIGDDHYVLM